MVVVDEQTNTVPTTGPIIKAEKEDTRASKGKTLFFERTLSPNDGMVGNDLPDRLEAHDYSLGVSAYVHDGTLPIRSKYWCCSDIFIRLLNSFHLLMFLLLWHLYRIQLKCCWIVFTHLLMSLLLWHLYRRIQLKCCWIVFTLCCCDRTKRGATSPWCPAGLDGQVLSLLRCKGHEIC